MFQRWFKRRRNSEIDRTPCPHCGAMILETATFCKHCGACESSGWQDESESFAGEDPDEEFDYDEFVQREFPENAAPKSNVKGLIIVVLLVCFVAGMLLSF